MRRMHDHVYVVLYLELPSRTFVVLDSSTRELKDLFQWPQLSNSDQEVNLWQLDEFFKVAPAFNFE